MEEDLESLIHRIKSRALTEWQMTQSIADIWKENSDTQSSPKIVTEVITFENENYTMSDFDDLITNKLKDVISSIMNKYKTAIIEGSLGVRVELESGFCIVVQMKYDEHEYLQTQKENEEYQQYLVLKEKYKDWN